MFESIEPGEQATSLYEELKSAYPDHVGAHTAMLQSLEPSEPKKLLPYIQNVDVKDNTIVNIANRIIAVADTVINQVDQTQILAYFGTKADHRADASKVKM